ncbi:MAG: hypothetical protein ACYDDF_14650 [Thermoplasmatota archaeon]
MSMPDVATTAFLFLSLGVASAALAYLVAQRAQGKPSPSIEAATEQGRLLESASKDLAAIRDKAAADGVAAEALQDLARAADSVTSAGRTLRKGTALLT